MAETLQHFGVKGMKWGVRRKSTTPPKGFFSQDAANAADARKKAREHGIISLTNKELQDLVTRMNLEQQFVRLQPQQRSSIAKGKKTLQGILATGKTINDVISFANSPAGQIIKKALIRT